VAFVLRENGLFRGAITAAQLEEAVKTNQPHMLRLVDESCPTVTTSTTLFNLVPLVANTDMPVCVLNETAELVGAVDRTAVILALSGVESDTGEAL
jgi:CBS-domain-containing membrane protein